MANRREEERERLRQAREERESSRAKAGRRRLMMAYGAAGAVGLVVLIGIGAVVASSIGGEDEGLAHIEQGSGSSNGLEPDGRKGTAPPPAKVKNLKKAARMAGCDLRLGLEDEGHTHIGRSASPPDYKTNPPTSGNHVIPPYQQADGAYAEMPDEINLVHSLEHGRMQIHYTPELSEEDQLAMKGLYDTMYGGTLLFPNSNMDYAVAASTWTNLLGCDEFKGQATFDAIRAFGMATWGRYGGEPVNAFALKGPTPAEPQ
ncbi:MAG TPA: DUF3105 domain-containing protein [Solirubrobacterales bacterium]